MDIQTIERSCNGGEGALRKNDELVP